MLQKLLKFMISILKFGGNSILALLFLTVLYLFFTIVLTLIPSNIFSEQPEKGITIYIKSNGVHTDLVLPVANKFYNWDEKIYQEDFALTTDSARWASFGWGDKGFYLYTPDWADLKFSTAFNALFLPSPTAMHVSVAGDTPSENELTKKIILSDEQYLILCDYIFTSFQKDPNENFILISGYHYKGVNDNFYEAEGSYHLFNTCNNWANSGLKTVGVKTATWAPFDKCIFYHFK